MRTALRERGFWGLLAAGIVYFYRPLFLGETFFFRDLYLSSFPQEARWVGFLRSGEMPFWDPYIHGGIPYIADISGSPFYPANLLGLVLQPTVASTLGIVLHFLAAAGAAYLLARRIGAGQPAAFLAGAAYAYCGFTLSQGNFLHRIQATAWVPLLILFWHLFLVDGRRRWFLLASGCGALQVLAGEPTVIAPCLILALGWGLALVPVERGPILRRVGLWAVFALTIAGLAAFQLLPTAELAGESTRGVGMSYSEFSFWSLHPLRLSELVLPGFLGPVDASSEDAYWGARLVDRGFPYFLSFYTGAVVLVLALLGVFERSPPHRRLRICLAIFAAVSLILAMGRYLPFFETLYHVVPGIRIFRYPVKLVMLGTLPLALLAAFGADVIFSRRENGRRRWAKVITASWIVAGVPVALLLVASRVPSWSPRVETWLFGSSGPRIADGIFSSAGHALGFAVLATLVGVLLRRTGSGALAWTFAVLVLADLMTAGRTLNPSAARELIEGVPPAARLVAGEIGDGRLFRDRQPADRLLYVPSDDVIWHHRWNQEVLQEYLATSFGIPMIFHSDYNGLEPLRTLFLAEAVANLPREKSAPILAAASVTVVMTHEETPELERVATVHNTSRVPVQVYRSPRAARRLEWIGLWHTAESKEEALRAMLAPGFDPRRHAVLEAPLESRSEAGCSSPARVELMTSRSAQRLYRVVAPCDGILVFSETFYPGCEVRIDGRRAPTWRANVAFTAAPVEAGEHEVEWRYVPRTFYRGLAVSGLALLGLLGWTLQSGGLRRRRTSKEERTVAIDECLPGSC